MQPDIAFPSLRRLARRTAPLLLATCAVASASTASAQDAAVEDEFTVQRFNPAPGPRNFFTTRGVRTKGEMAWSAGLMVNYAYKPFVVRSCESETNCDDPNAVQGDDVQVVENMVTGDFMGSLTPIERLQIGLRVPVTWVKGQGITEEGQADSEGISAVGLGDAELEGKFRLYGEPDDTIVAGVGAFITGPLGTTTAEGNYIGDSSPTLGLRGIFDGNEGPFSFGANLTGMWRGSARVGSTELGPEMRYGVAGGFEVSPVLRLVADAFGSTKFSAKNGTNALEVDGGIQVTPLGSPFLINAGVGTGLVQGVGVPTVRAFAGLMYIAEGEDRDGDGIPDQADQCPTEPEDEDGRDDDDGCPDQDNDGDLINDDQDKCPTVAEDPDGFEDTDGCPEDDNDKDGIPDNNDRCSDKAETKNRFKDDDGCPDEPDRDGDGVPDSKDQCKDDAEDTDGYQDTDGCPDPDNDGDGVPDNKDECVDKPENINGYQDEDGCPDQAKDTDNDGIPDPIDKCPRKAETINGRDDEDGCPDGRALVKVTAGAIELKGTVRFKTGSDEITGNNSFRVLDSVATVLKSTPAIRSVEIAGHTDSRGDDAKNKELSQKRAESVKKYLMDKHKIEGSRLKPVGYGEEKPVSSNESAAGRRKNRRVEFKILEQK